MTMLAGNNEGFIIGNRNPAPIQSVMPPIAETNRPVQPSQGIQINCQSRMYRGRHQVGYAAFKSQIPSLPIHHLPGKPQRKF